MNASTVPNLCGFWSCGVAMRGGDWAGTIERNPERRIGPMRTAIAKRCLYARESMVIFLEMEFCDEKKGASGLCNFFLGAGNSQEGKKGRLFPCLLALLGPVWMQRFRSVLPTNRTFLSVSKPREGYFHSRNGRPTERSHFCQTSPYCITSRLVSVPRTQKKSIKPKRSAPNYQYTFLLNFLLSSLMHPPA